MRFRRVAVILMIPLVIELVIACCNCDEYPFTNYYDFTSYYSHTEILAYNIDNSGPFSHLPLNDSVNAEAFGIRVIIDRQEVIPEEASPTAVLKFRGLMQNTYAFDCFCFNEVYYEAKDEVDSVKITSLHEFDAYHPAGSDVSDYFLVLWNNDMLTLDRFPQYISWTPFDPEDKAIEFNVLLMNIPDPDMPPVHAFNLDIYVSDGRILHAETDELTLIP